MHNDNEEIDGLMSQVRLLTDWKGFYDIKNPITLRYVFNVHTGRGLSNNDWLFYTLPLYARSAPCRRKIQ